MDDEKKELERKDEFISVASHELRTPLTSIKGYLQLIEYMDHLPDDVRTYVGKANNSLNKLQRLINELLDASRIKAGKLTYSKSIFNLTSLVEACVENSSHIFQSHKINRQLEQDV